MTALPRLLRAALIATGIIAPCLAQLVDKTVAPNTEGAGIAKGYDQQIGAGRGDEMTPDSSRFIIARDPFRAIRRGRQLFQRKFTVAQGVGPRVGDGSGDVNQALAIGAGLADSCAACHGRPRGAAGFGGDVVTRPDSRDAQHLFGLGLKEMLADEITADLRATRAAALSDAINSGIAITRPLRSKGIGYGSIIARPDGSFDTSKVEGVDADLRVRPFFAHGGTFAIREFIVGAMQNEMGLQAVEQDLARAKAGEKVITPSGMLLDGTADQFDGVPTSDAGADPDGDGVSNEVPEAIVDYLEFYLLNYFKPATYNAGDSNVIGRRTFEQIGCSQCHISDLTIQHDRRVADVETAYDPLQAGEINALFATASTRYNAVDDQSGFPALKRPVGGSFVVKNFFSDLKRHNLGPKFHERNYDGTIRTQFITSPLWGVGSSAPYGHDGRSINLNEVILRHGGEAQAARDAFARLAPTSRRAVLDFLNSLVLFPPDDTPSNLDPGNPSTPGYPQRGHGSIKLGVLFNDPKDPE